MSARGRGGGAFREGVGFEPDEPEPEPPPDAPGRPFGPALRGGVRPPLPSRPLTGRRPPARVRSGASNPRGTGRWPGRGSGPRRRFGRPEGTVEAAQDRRRYAAALPITRPLAAATSSASATSSPRGRARLRRSAAEVDDGGKPGGPDGDVVRPSRHGRPNVSVITTATRDAARRERGADPRRAGIRILRQERQQALGDVRHVHAGVRADEPVARLGDHELVAARHHAHGTRARPSPACPARRPRGTSRPSAFDTTFCVTARMSPSRSGDRRGAAAPSIRTAARSSPGRTSGSP